MSKFLISTQAKISECRCGAEVLAGRDQGLRARVDSTPTDASGEIAALVEGRRTYALVAGELVHRDANRIRGGLVGRGIYVEHRCATYVQPSLIGATA